MNQKDGAASDRISISTRRFMIRLRKELRLGRPRTHAWTQASDRMSVFKKRFTLTPRPVGIGRAVWRLELLSDFEANWFRVEIVMASSQVKSLE